MSISDDIADGLAEVEGDIPLTFNWNNVAYPCTAGTATNSKELGIGGFAGIADLIINIRASLFGTGAQPLPEQTGTYSGTARVYRIQSVANPPGSSFVQLALVDRARKL